MNFLGIIHKAAPIVGEVGKLAGFGVSLVNPALGSIITRISDGVVKAEAQLPQDGQGATKLQMVGQDFEAGLTVAQSILATQGKALAYDPKLLEAAISAQVASFNAYKALVDSIKLTDVPKS